MYIFLIDYLSVIEVKNIQSNLTSYFWHSNKNDYETQVSVKIDVCSSLECPWQFAYLLYVSLSHFQGEE